MSIAQPTPGNVDKSAGLAVTPEHLLDTPLPQLLTELDIKVTTSNAGPGFTGAVCIRKDGSLLLVQPTDRPDKEWDMIARAMLGQALGVKLPPLPDLYQLTEL
ncbi:hypothetical protein ACGFZR_15285 [Streptomyces sp. NPDC048241]|uniref:hypothetical protein n=1 Tax=Streptomyces sp. NPDC048241 TaxID=3365521 RepID=UPI0037180BC2